MEQTIAAIARRSFDLPDLQEQGSDGLDFIDVHVTCLRGALEAAYRAGQAAAASEAAG